MEMEKKIPFVPDLVRGGAECIKNQYRLFLCYN